jgi:major type 1 subunit fimbrin (pilin)
MTLPHPLRRKTLSNLSLPLLGLAACAVASQAAANSGVITFQGEATAATCIVEGGSTNLPDFTVELPAISSDGFTQGDIAGRTRFAMRLTNCSGVVNGVRAHFEAGTTVDAASGTLLPDNGGSVHFALFDQDGAPIDVGTHHQGPIYAATDATNDTMYYEVAYQRVGSAPIVAGQFSGTVAYTLQYE